MDDKIYDLVMNEYPHERKNAVHNKQQSLKNYLDSDNIKAIEAIKKKFTNEQINDIKNFEMLKISHLPPPPSFSKSVKKYKDGELAVILVI